MWRARTDRHLAYERRTGAIGSKVALIEAGKLEVFKKQMAAACTIETTHNVEERGFFRCRMVQARQPLRRAGPQGPRRAMRLRHILMSYMNYYNAARTHLSLGKDAPVRRIIQRAGRIEARPVLGGLHHQYVRI